MSAGSIKTIASAILFSCVFCSLQFDSVAGTIKGSIKDNKGHPVHLATLMLYEASEKPGTAIVTYSDSNGNFSFNVEEQSRSIYIPPHPYFLCMN